MTLPAPAGSHTKDLARGRGPCSNGWSRRWDSNPRPTVYETVALPLSYFGPAGPGGERLGAREGYQPDA